VRGNGKLGGDILAFNLPAVVTCPGQTDACLSACYARKGNFAWSATRAKHEANLREAWSPSFVARMVREITVRAGAVVRWHVSGDFFSAAYAKRVLQIVKKTPGVVHYFYTRSWRVPRVRRVLLQLAAEPNVRSWWSCDRDSGAPFPVPEGVRLAWMLTYPEEERTHADHIAACDLVFRTCRCRHTPATRAAGVPVCPVESGLSDHVTCGTCRICYR
jgi:hypothetical protein